MNAIIPSRDDYEHKLLGLSINQSTVLVLEGDSIILSLGQNQQSQHLNNNIPLTQQEKLTI